MTFDLAEIQRSKREFRQRLAARPIAEKLAMLDALRARSLALHPPQPTAGTGVLREESAPYRAPGKESR